MDVNSAILERLEKVVDTLQENSVKMGQLLAVHNEKLDKQDRIDAVLFEKVEKLHECVEQRSREIKEGCERDIRLVDKRLRTLERKMWSIAWWYCGYLLPSLSCGSENHQGVVNTTDICYTRRT